mmetsp:Transcript_5373/g.17845  ORF Transcript_5373/g.17845 Transcript_5373/m.17845 type:complete len:260 (-) Transcript_5373:693-1472(-)
MSERDVSLLYCISMFYLRCRGIRYQMSSFLPRLARRASIRDHGRDDPFRVLPSFRVVSIEFVIPNVPVTSIPRTHAHRSGFVQRERNALHGHVPFSSVRVQTDQRRAHVPRPVHQHRRYVLVQVAGHDIPRQGFREFRAWVFPRKLVKRGFHELALPAVRPKQENNHEVFRRAIRDFPDEGRPCDFGHAPEPRHGRANPKLLHPPSSVFLQETVIAEIVLHGLKLGSRGSPRDAGRVIPVIRVRGRHKFIGHELRRARR